MAKRDTLWLPFDTGSINTVANTQNGVEVDTVYVSIAQARFKGTILAIKGMVAIRQDSPSNALERFSLACRVQPKNGLVTEPDLWDDPSKLDFWRLDGYIGGPGGDSTALVNVMAGFTFPMDGRSKRTMGFGDSIEFVWKTSAIAKLGASGRILLLEA